MLVLSRKKGERILIGGDVTIEVVEVRGDKVWLGITAPKSTRVDREEVRQRIEIEGRQSDLGQSDQAQTPSPSQLEPPAEA